MMRRAAAALALLTAAAAAAAAPAGAAPAKPSAHIQRTEHGVPHIIADDDRGLGYGYGYAVAEDNVCLLAESYVTVGGERSRFFGPDGTFAFHANDTRHRNLDSDLFYRSLEPAPRDRLRPGVRDLVRGYVEGYNAYVAETGPDGISDPACKGEPWVRPITEDLAYARFAQLASLAGAGIAITGVARAQPPTPAAPPPSSRDRDADVTELGRRLELGGLGSNAIALGREATRSGAGMVLGNPHLPWDGDYRLYQAHLTIPGELDVSGATFIGVPLVLIGHTRGLAWSHTTSSAFRFTPFELQLVPGRPTTYLVDGRPREMTSERVSVDVHRPDGSMGTVSRTLWSTDYGPVLTEILGLPVFPWTPTTAYAFADANADNLRFLDHFYDTNRAQRIAGLDRALRRHLGIPWATTVAADADGQTLFADASVVPHVTDEHATRCNTALGVVAFARLRLPILDGSRSACRWGADADAPVAGVLGPGRLPFLERGDYVSNSNDSHWLSNPEQPLEGFARIVGDERTERSLRSRLALRMIRERRAGTDGREGRGFTLGQLQDIQFDDRNGAAELLRDELVGLCRSLPALPSTRGGAVAKGEACDVLASWDGRDRAESRGALLFRRWAERALPRRVPGSNAVGGAPPQEGTWADAFDPERPVDTPHRLNTANPVVQAALGDAVADLRDAGIALDAPLGAYQVEPRGGKRIPMHGGPGRLGVFNALNVKWVAGEGYPRIPHGATFIMATELRGACPPTRTLVAYSQSADPTSPWHADQTHMYASRRWVTERFCARDVLRSPRLQTRRLGCLPTMAGSRGGTLAWLRPGTSARRARTVTGPPDLRAARRWRWCVAGGGHVRAALSGDGRRRVALVATTARGQRVGGVRPGQRVRARGWRHMDGGLRARNAGRRAVVIRVRRDRVGWVGLVSRRTARSPDRVRALARRAGLPVAPTPG